MAGDREDDREGNPSRELLFCVSQAVGDGILTTSLILEVLYVGSSARKGEQLSEVEQRHARQRGREQATRYLVRRSPWFTEPAEASEDERQAQCDSSVVVGEPALGSRTSGVSSVSSTPRPLANSQVSSSSTPTSKSVPTPPLETTSSASRSSSTPPTRLKVNPARRLVITSSKPWAKKKASDTSSNE